MKSRRTSRCVFASTLSMAHTHILLNQTDLRFQSSAVLALQEASEGALIAITLLVLSLTPFFKLTLFPSLKTLTWLPSTLNV